MSFPFPINFTHNRFRTQGQDGWRGDNKYDNTTYTLATNVYPKLNDSDNTTKRTFGKARPIKHIRKGRYEKGSKKTYNNSRLLYELDRPGGATVKPDLSKSSDGCNGVSSTLFLMTKTSSACCPQVNSLKKTRQSAGNHTLEVQYKSHQSYSNYHQGRNWDFERLHQVSGKNSIGNNTYLKDVTIKKKGCGEVVHKLSNERFGINGAATSANYTQSLRNRPFVHPNINEFVNHIRCEVIMKCTKTGKCLPKSFDSCKKIIKLFKIVPMQQESEPQPEGHFNNTERVEVDTGDAPPTFYQPEPEPEPEAAPQPEPEPEPESFPPMSGSIVKGYISNSTVNYYKASDPSYNRLLLATTTTDDYGKFLIPTEDLPSETYLLQISSGGVDIATGLGLGDRTFKHVFKIPSSAVEARNANNTVTALTSMVSEKVEKTIAEADEGVEITDSLVESNLNEEKSSLKANLGLSEDADLGTDYLSQGSSDSAAMAAVNTMVNSLLNIVSGVQSFADTMANLTNVLTQKRDVSQTDSLLDTSNLDSVVKSTLNTDVAADTALADTLVTYSTKVKEAVDEVAAADPADGATQESVLENLEKMVKYTSQNTVADVSNNLDNISASQISSETTVFQIFTPQPEPEPEPIEHPCQGFKEQLLKFDKLEGGALSQLSQYISFFRDGEFTSLASSQNNLTQISNLINSQGYFTFSQDEIIDYESDETLFAEYKIFAHSMIDGLNAAILMHTQNSILSAANTQLEQFKTILTNKELLQEYIEVNFNNFNAGLVSVEHTLNQGLQLEEHYQLYINRHGIPANGIFDSNLLSEIYNELNGIEHQPSPEGD
tara:strand:- start:33 stop:2525 length:2493 start_codon:yes stop_codon:yes gene_type:complete